MVHELQVNTPGQGLHECTALVAATLAQSGIAEGLCTIMIRHTSASLTIQENADPSARADLETWLNRLVPETDPHFTHTAEGSDDMPAHIKAALTATTLSIPVVAGQLALGTWQGIFVWEHRRAGGTRRIMMHVGP
jgi:secondary thiamine-phosphate synthase enzyme